MTGKPFSFNTITIRHQGIHTPPLTLSDTPPPTLSETTPPTLSENTHAQLAHGLFETLAALAHGLLACMLILVIASGRAAFSLGLAALQPSSHAVATPLLKHGRWHRSSPAHTHLRAGVLLMAMMLVGSASAKDAPSDVPSPNSDEALSNAVGQDVPKPPPAFGWMQRLAEQSQSQAQAESEQSHPDGTSMLDGQVDHHGRRLCVSCRAISGSVYKCK